MDTDSVTNTIKVEPLTVEETDDSCIFKYFEVVPLATDCPAEVKQEDMAVVKNEPDNVCFTIFEDDGFSAIEACQFYAAFFKNVHRMNTKCATEICGNH